MAFSLLNEVNKRPTAMDLARTNPNKKLRFMSPYSDTSGSNDSDYSKKFGLKTPTYGDGPTKRSVNVAVGDKPDGDVSLEAVPDYLTNPLMLRRSYDLTRSGSKRVDVGLLLQNSDKAGLSSPTSDEEPGLKYVAAVHFRDTDNNLTIAMSADVFRKFIEEYFEIIEEGFKDPLALVNKEFEIDGIFLQFIIMHKKFGIALRRDVDIARGDRRSFIMLDTTVRMLLLLKTALKECVNQMDVTVKTADKCKKRLVQEVVLRYCNFEEKYFSQAREVVKSGKFRPLEFFKWNKLPELSVEIDDPAYYYSEEKCNEQVAAIFADIVLFYTDYIKKSAEENISGEDCKFLSQERLI